ncbi:hypothetical protein COV20_00160 [Candidatus Woesearchaeota archaeon CG10_big_fil_rev_8_21_14_0_10_45_16]|nr:MAG: hypothetical protein COV20_00160 [Candidatus Woesearchaeota archaeon CG10_big_fil_rev_8_21_14_0_10_45_16]
MLIGKTLISEDAVKEIILAIKKKKELSGINDDFVREQLFSYLKKNQQKAAVLQQNNPKAAAYKQVIKDVRSQLRRVYGLFRVDEERKKREDLKTVLEEAPENKLKQVSSRILETHSSTKERLPIYEKIYDKIFAITGKPRRIIDLGCGLNPFSFPSMRLRKAAYHAYDISQSEIELLEDYFKRLHDSNPHFQGYAEILDILHWQYLQHLETADVCFLFKMTDVLDRGKGHKVTEEVLKAVPARYVVISFATKTMSGKKMTAPRRKWMEWLCDRLQYEYNVLSFPNEIFYVIKK